MKKSGFRHITVAVNHLSNLIETYIGDGSKYSIRIDYSHEEQELSTIGPLKLIGDLPNNFVVMNGDILCDIDYGEFFNSHLKSGADISVSSYKREVNIDFGVLNCDEAGHLTEFQEKPTFDFKVSMGIYAMKRSALNHISPGMKYGFDELMIEGISSGKHIRLAQFDGFWLDIGRPDDYAYADENFDELSKKILE